MCICRACGGEGGRGLGTNRPDRGPPFPVPSGAPVRLPLTSPGAVAGCGLGVPLGLTAGCGLGLGLGFGEFWGLGTGVGVASGISNSGGLSNGGGVGSGSGGSFASGSGGGGSSCAFGSPSFSTSFASILVSSMASSFCGVGSGNFNHQPQ